MGKDCGSWQKPYPCQPPLRNCVNVQPYLGQQNVAHPMERSVFASHCSVSVSKNVTGIAVPKNFELKSCSSACNSSYYPQNTLSWIPKLIPGKEFSACQCVKAAPIQKKFFVMDQSWNQTSLFFLSMGHNFQEPLSNVKIPDFNASNLAVAPEKGNLVPFAAEKVGCHLLDGDHEGGISGGSEGEVQEDTEEIDALLFSDDEDEDEDEVTSTGHSPYEMLECEKDEVDDCDDTASFVTPMKRKRLVREVGPMLMDTACSKRNWVEEVGTQSSCIKGRTFGPGPSVSKRLKTERIHNAVSVLRSLVSGGRGSKDAITVLDEAIHYLKSMQLKAKTLGVAALV